MTDVCSCAEAGFCERRKCLMSGLHFRRCQDGQVAILDHLYKNKLEPVPPIKQSDMVLHEGGRGGSVSERRAAVSTFGTRLQAAFERLFGATIKCGTCKTYLRSLNNERHHDVNAVAERLLHDLPIPHTKRSELGDLNGQRAWLRQTVRQVSDEQAARRDAAHRPSRHKHANAIIPAICRTPLDAITPRPFTAHPRMTLICHCWPNGDGWRQHAEYLAPVAEVFTRKIMGVATGPGTATFAEVQAVFGDLWEYFEVANDKKLREVLTYQQMLPMVNTTNENDVTFCMHLKGVQNHTTKSDQIKWWIEAMYATVIYNWKNVLLKMAEGYPIVGSFVRTGKHLKTRYEWHYSGTFYAVRNAATFMDGIPQLELKWYGTESWPGHHFARHEAACMFGDNCGDLYKPNTKTEHELNEWKEHNDTL